MGHTPDERCVRLAAGSGFESGALHSVYVRNPDLRRSGGGSRVSGRSWAVGEVDQRGDLLERVSEAVVADLLGVDLNALEECPAAPRRHP